MRKFLAKACRFGKAENGPTAVEYAVLIALITLVCLASIARLGRRSRTTFNNAARSLAR